MPSNPNRRKKTTKRPLCWNNRRDPIEQFFSEKSAKKHAMQWDKWESTHRIFFVRYTVGISFFEAGKITTLNLSRGKVGLCGTKKTCWHGENKDWNCSRSRVKLYIVFLSNALIFVGSWILFKTLRNVHWKQVFFNVGATILFRFIPSWIATVEKSIFPSRPETPRSIQLHPKTAACAMAKVGRWSWPSNASTQQGSLMTWPIGPTSSINWHQFLHHQSIKSWIHPWYWMGKPDHGITCPQVSCSFGYFLAYEKAMGQKSSTHQYTPIVERNKIIEYSS